MKKITRSGVALLLATGFLLPLASREAQAGLDGIMIYEMRCVACHDKPQDRTPSRELLEKRTPEDIIRALKTGPMQTQAAGLTDEQIRDVALFLTQKDLGMGALAPEPNRCGAPTAKARAGAEWNGWGPDVHNSRFQPEPGLAAGDVPRLKLKWAFGYRGTITYGQPTLADGRLYVTSANGRVYALDPATGCVHWTVDVGAGVRTAVSVGTLGRGAKARRVAYFGDELANLYAVDAATGERLWQQKLETHASARITGAPALYRGRLYVPLSSAEEGVGRATNYACCTFRGSVAAVDARTGRLIWRGYTIAQEPKPYRKNSDGGQLYGPAGAAIWSTPAIDAKRGLVYVATGNSYTDVGVTTSNAVMAFDLRTGHLKWANQATPGDNYLVLCMQPGVANCPQQLGPDVDFGSPPILRTIADGSRKGRQVVLAGQKSGVVYAFDPDDGGKLLWSVKVGRGGPGGGVEWGPAADGRNIYVAISDELPIPGNVAGGLTALDIATGEKRWFAPPPPAVCGWGPRNCSPAQSAAISVMPGVVFSGAMDGHLRAFATDDGRVLWDFDSGRAFDTVNGVLASGGSFDGGGPAIAGGMLFVNSGYGKFAGQPGNVLLAFSVDGH